MQNGVRRPIPTTTISCQSGANLATIKRKSGWDILQCISHSLFGLRWRSSATITINNPNSNFLSEGSQMQRSAKKMRIGCTKAYYLFAFSFVSGSRCCLIVLNYMWMAQPNASSAASITASCIDGCAWMVRAMRCALTPSTLARVGSPIISVTL